MFDRYGGKAHKIKNDQSNCNISDLLIDLKKKNHGKNLDQ